MRCGCGESECLHYCVVQIAPHLLNLLILARRVYAIRQEHHKQLPVGIDPDGCPREPGVPEAVSGKILSAQSARCRHGPAKRTRSAGKLLRRGELRHRPAPQNPLVRVHAAVQQHLAKRRQIWRGAEYARVPGHTANRKGIFVVHFTLHQPVPQILVKLRRRNLRPQLFRRLVHRVFHSEGQENKTVRQVIELSSRQSFDNLRHQNNSQVRIDFLRSRLVLERFRKDLRQGILLALRCSPVLLECRQS